MPDLFPAEVGIFDRHPEIIEITGFALFRFRRNDIKMCFSTFYETINNKLFLVLKGGVL
jgi:hypothetical protein